MDSFPIKDGKFVAGKGEHNYKEVIDDFKNASFIGIVTFNLSQNESGTLISKLKEACKSGTMATVITNIPKRFSNYFEDKYAFAASTVIKKYIRFLKAENFDMRISAFFNFSNHAKIIMTNNVVYWGSANYSDESKNNYECGVISRDAELIRKIRDVVFPEIISKSVPYYRYNVAEAIANLNDAYSVCASAWSEIYDASFEEWSDYETHFQPQMIYRTNDSGISAKMLQIILEKLEGFEDALSVVSDVIDYYYERYDNLPEEAEHLEKLYEEYQKDFDDMLSVIRGLFEDIEQLAHYSWDDEVSRIVNEDYGMESFDENLDHYMQLAMDEANGDYSTLIEEAEPAIKEIMESLEMMQDYYRKMHDTLYSLLQLNSVIDNTGVR